MISEDMYADYENEYSDVPEFEKFARKPGKAASKAVKTTRIDEINAKRRERQLEREMMIAKQDDGIVVFKQ